MAELVRYALDGKVATITMDDGKANALSSDMIKALLGAIDRAETEAGAMVLAGREGKFCGGFDLKVMMSGPANATALLLEGSELLLRLYGSKIPLVVACTGHAVAGGSLVAITGDERIGAIGDYKIGLNEVAIGLPVPVLAMELARDRLLPTELVRATQLAQLYTPEQAVRAGYLDEVVALPDVITRAQARAAQFAGFARMAFVNTRTRLRGRTIAHIRATLADDLKSLLSPA